MKHFHKESNRIFNNTKVFKTPDEANEYMESVDGYGLLEADDEKKLYYVANIHDKGQPVKEHKIYSLGYDAHRNTSFSPEVRGVGMVQFWLDIENEIRESFKPYEAPQAEYWKNRLYKTFTNWLCSKSRCISTMITGGANFPVRRAEKANASEHKRSDELSEALEKMRRAVFKLKNPDAGGISSDDENALEKLKLKLSNNIKNHELMKKYNSWVRKQKGFKDITEEKRVELIKKAFPDSPHLENMGAFSCYGSLTFETFTLGGSNAKRKAIEQRIKEMKVKEKMETTSCSWCNGAFEVVQNIEANRYQIVFDGKPASDIIRLLKSKGFKWSPRFTAWQRMINANGRFALGQVLPQIKRLLEECNSDKQSLGGI